MTTAPHRRDPRIRTSRREALTARPFVVHYLQMLAAMLAGMVVFGPLAMVVASNARAEVHALLMATAMAVGMVALMLRHRNSRAAVVEMCLAMYLSFLALVPGYWLGLLSETALIGLGHVLMLPLMLVAMLHRREEYLAHEAHGG